MALAPSPAITNGIVVVSSPALAPVVLDSAAIAWTPVLPFSVES